MLMDKQGLNLSRGGLRYFLGMQKEIYDFKCYAECDECCIFDDDNGCCMFDDLKDIFDRLFRGLVL